MTKREDYIYTKLKDVKVSYKINVYGIITELVKIGNITKTGKVHSIIAITDETLPKNKSFRIHFFLSPEDSSPKLQEGNIVRLHRMKVETWDGDLDGRVFRGSDVAIFPGIGNSGFTYTTQAKNMTFTEKDKARIEELREVITINTLFPEVFDAKETASQRVAVSDEDDDDEIKANVPDDEDKISKDEDLSRVVNPASTKVLLLNPMNAIVMQLHRQKSSKNDVEKGHEVAGTSTDTRSSGVPQVFLREDGLKRKLNSSDGDKGTVSGPSASLESVEDEISPRQKILRTDKASEDLEAEKLSTSEETRLSPKKEVRSPAVAHVAPICNQHVESDQEIIEDDLVSATVLSNKIKETENARHNSNDGDSMLVQNGSLAGSLEVSSCPGVACAGKDCLQEPIILEDDDPRLHGFKEEDLLAITEGEGDIPAANEDGKIICRPEGYMQYGSGQSATQVTVKDLTSFQWPRFRTKVKIVDVKPNLMALKAFPKDLLSGTCSKCYSYTFYSRLKWKKEQESLIKKPMCPVCFKTGHEEFVCIEYRLKLTLRDAWGSNLEMHAIKSHASALLGFTAAEYIRDKTSQTKVYEMLSEVISSKSSLSITFFQVLTPIRVMYFICDTDLKEASE